MEKIRTKPFTPYNPIGKEEAKAAYRVVKDGMLSDYLGKHSENFAAVKMYCSWKKPGLSITR